MDLLPRSGRIRPARRAAAVAVGVALAATTLGAGSAIAAGNVYTGCVSQGTLFNVAVGNSPLSGCSSGTLIRWNQQGAKGAKGAKGERGRRGAKGEPGERGAKGETGPRGAAGADLELTTYSVAAVTTGLGDQLMQATVSCDSGDVATGGGFETDGLILASIGFGEPSPSGWRAVAQANTDQTELTVSVVCADLPPLR